MERRRPIGFWLKLLDGLIDQRLDATLSRWSLDRRQWQVINLLNDSPGSKEEAMAALEPFGRQTVEVALADLTASGLVAATDGRLRLTTTGENVLGEAHAGVNEDRQRIADGIEADDYLRTIETLRRMAMNLGWRDPDDQP